MNMLKTKYLIASSVFLIIATTACVPARKFEEVQAKYDECSEELAELKKDYEELEAAKLELESQVEQLTNQNNGLENDTAIMRSNYRNLTEQYDKLAEVNKFLQEQLEKQNQYSAAENANLKAELELMKADLLKQEEELNKQRAELEDKIAHIEELEALLAKQSEAVELLRQTVADALLNFQDKGLTVEIKNGKVYVSLEAKLLFPSGSTVVNDEGKQALIQLAEVLEGQTDLDILVEGHTDTDAISSSSIPRNNWELSVLRATAVVQIMLDNSSIDPKILTAAGRSEFIPVDPNNKAKNRRIEVILIPNLDELFTILDETGQ